MLGIAHAVWAQDSGLQGHRAVVCSYAVLRERCVSAQGCGIMQASGGGAGLSGGMPFEDVPGQAK